ISHIITIRIYCAQTERCRNVHTIEWRWVGGECRRAILPGQIIQSCGNIECTQAGGIISQSTSTGTGTIHEVTIKYKTPFCMAAVEYYITSKGKFLDAN